MNIQPAGRATFWWSMGTPGEIMQESKLKHSRFTIAEIRAAKTIIYTVEQLLNNRRLTVSGSETTGLEALAPNHLLLRRSTNDHPKVVSDSGSGAIK